jgi:hypothetical protein
MNFQQVEKVTKLIQISPILSSEERGEWLLLLDLMNDKQMFELEKILSSGRLSLSQMPGILPKPAVLPEIPKANVPRSLSQEVSNFKSIPPVHRNFPQPLHLSHIMNLPRTKEIKEPPVFKQPTVQTREDKKGFLQRLKDALSEKELPPGEREKEKELPAPAKVQKVQSEPKPILQEKNIPKTLEPLNIPKPVDIPQIVIKPVINLQIKEERVKEEKVNESKRLDEFLAQSKYSNLAPRHPQTVLEKEDKPEIWNIEPQNLQVFPEKQKIETQISQARPGVALADILRSKLTDNAKKEPEVEDIGKEMVLSDFQKLALLNPGNLDEFSSHSIIAQIRKFIKTSGYHEVLFNLEKSSLYKAYIETGASVLNDKGDFDGAGQTKLPLTRPQFEKFADILRQIQAA